jgi:hypothetical protein
VHIPQVTVACLWAACFNKLLLPWTSREWAQEQICAALTAAAAVLDTTAQLQFKAARTQPAAAADAKQPAATSNQQFAGQPGTKPTPSTAASSSSNSSSAELASALLAQESALQARLVEPVVAVQTGEGSMAGVHVPMCAHRTLWHNLLVIVWGWR